MAIRINGNAEPNGPRLGATASGIPQGALPSLLRAQLPLAWHQLKSCQGKPELQRSWVRWQEDRPATPLHAPEVAGAWSLLLPEARGFVHASQGGASEERLGPRAGYVEGLSHWLSMRNRNDPPTGLWSMPMLWDKVAVGTLNCRGVAQISEARFLDIWKRKSAALAAGQVARTGVSTWTPSAEPRRKRSTTFRTWSYSTASRPYPGSYPRAFRK